MSVRPSQDESKLWCWRCHHCELEGQPTHDKELAAIQGDGHERRPRFNGIALSGLHAVSVVEVPHA